MGCYLQYGSYRHETNGASFTVNKSVTLNDAQQPYAEVVTWQIEGQLGSEGDSTATIAAKARNLELAYAVWGRDLAFCDENGTVLQVLLNAGSLTGTRVLSPPSFPKGDGPEFQGIRTYSITVSAEYPMTGALNGGGLLLKSFQEKLSFVGGGPRRTVLELVNGPPQPQTLALYTAARATQQGSAVGLFGYPPAPLPIFGESMLEETPQIEYSSPTLKNGIYTDFGVSWTFKFISPSPLAGSALPNVWPAG